MISVKLYSLVLISGYISSMLPNNNLDLNKYCEVNRLRIFFCSLFKYVDSTNLISLFFN